ELADRVRVVLPEPEGHLALHARLREVEVEVAVADPRAVVEEREVERAEGDVIERLDRDASTSRVGEGLSGGGVLRHGDVHDLPTLAAVTSREVEVEAVAVGVVVGARGGGDAAPLD